MKPLVRENGGFFPILLLAAASRRYDRAQDVVSGVAADVWVRTEDDLLRSLTIVEPILVRR